MTAKRKKPTTGADRATDSKIEDRVQAIMKFLRGRSDGPEAVFQMVAEKEQAGEEPWQRGPGCNPLSERTIERDMSRASKRLHDEHLIETKKMLLLHRRKRKKPRGIKSGVDFAKSPPPFQSRGAPQ